MDESGVSTSSTATKATDDAEAANVCNANVTSEVYAEWYRGSNGASTRRCYASSGVAGVPHDALSRTRS